MDPGTGGGGGRASAGFERACRLSDTVRRRFLSPPSRLPRRLLLRRHIHSHSRRRLFSASSSMLTHSDEASTHVDADGVVDVNPPRGTRDFPPEDMLRTWLFDQFWEVSSLMAFEEVDFPRPRVGGALHPKGWGGDHAAALGADKVW